MIVLLKVEYRTDEEVTTNIASVYSFRFNCTIFGLEFDVLSNTFFLMMTCLHS